MDMLNPMLLGGAALAAVPVVLHLIMRQQPRRLEFPALRFLRALQESNRRRLKLRHLLLLLLRVGFVCLLALALARPSIRSSSGMIGDREAPAAVAIVVDTSPRMLYVQENQTRLEKAQATAEWLLGELPPDSQAAIVDSRPAPPVFQVDLAAARQRLARLEPTGAARPLAERIADAAELLNDAPQERKELYVFTDLAETAWSGNEAAALPAKLAETPNVGLYLVDVGVDKPQDLSLGGIQLSSQLLARNSPLRISSELSGLGVGGQRTIELYMLDKSGRSEKRAETIVDLPADASRPVDFAIGGLDLGAQQGFMRIVGSDALPVDDVQYFTVDVKPPWKLLVMAQRPADYHAANLTEALAPVDFRRNGQARFEFDVVDFDAWEQPALDEYAAVLLLDPPQLPDGAWRRLADYAAAGGSVATFLGPAADIKTINASAARELLPGALARQARYPDGDLAITTEATQHPALGKFAPLRGAVPWEDFPIIRYWQFDNVDEGVGVVAALTNGDPVLLEKRIGSGRSVVMTSPVSELAETPDTRRWNFLWGAGAWPFFTLANELTLYLVGSAEERLNYTAGEPAVVEIPLDRRSTTYLLSAPGGEEQRVQPANDSGTIIVGATDAAGNYRLRAGGAADGVDRGFSVNLPDTVSRLERIDAEKLAALFGDVKFRLADNQESLSRDVSVGRVGQELYPLLIALAACALAFEHVLANRFYRRAPAPPAGGA